LRHAIRIIVKKRARGLGWPSGKGALLQSGRKGGGGERSPNLKSILEKKISRSIRIKIKKNSKLPS